MLDGRDRLEAVLKDPEYDYYVRQWIDYQANHQNRAKLLHDIRLMDGREFIGYYPNADAWNRFMGGPGPVKVHDSQVSHIRLSEKQIGDTLG